MGWSIGGGGSGGSGGGLTPEQELTLQYFYYDSSTNTLKADRTIESQPSSLAVGRYVLTSGGEVIFTSNLSQDINYYSIMGGLKNQSVHAGVDKIVTPSTQHYTEEDFTLEPNGSVAPSGVADYEVNWSVPGDINVSIFRQSTILEEDIAPDDWVLYEEGPGNFGDPVTFDQWLTGITLSAGDVFEWYFDTPVNHSGGSSGFTRISIAKGSQDAARTVLKVRTGTTNPTERYVDVSYNNWTPQAVMSGVVNVAASQNVIYGSHYGVNTTSGAVTLTVDNDFTANQFVVFDDSQNFDVNACTVALPDGQGNIVLNQRNSIVMFYYDITEAVGSRWKTRDFNAPTSTTTFFDAASAAVFSYTASMANNEARLIASGTIVGIAVIDVATFSDFTEGDIVNIVVDSTYTAQTPFAYVDRTDSSGNPTRQQISRVLRMQRGVTDWTIIESGLAVDPSVTADDVVIYDDDTNNLIPAPFGSLIGGSQAITQSLPIDVLNITTNQTVVIPDDCTVIAANVDNAVLTLDFGDPSTLDLDTIKSCLIYCNPSNGGSIKFLINSSSWINNGVTEYETSSLSVAETRVFNNTSQNGGIIQEIPVDQSRIASYYEMKGGYGLYNDSGASSTFLPANTWVTMTNDAAGPETDESNLPPSVSTLYNTTTNTIVVDDVLPSSNLEIRADFVVNPNLNNTILDVELEVITKVGGTPVSTEYRPFGSQQLGRGAGIDYNNSVVKPFGVPDLQAIGITVEASIRVRASRDANLLVSRYYIGVSS